MIFGFRRNTLRERRIIKRKKHTKGLLSKLLTQQAILEIELEKIKKEIEDARKDLKDIIKREEQQNG